MAQSTITDYMAEATQGPTGDEPVATTGTDQAPNPTGDNVSDRLSSQPEHGATGLGNEASGTHGTHFPRGQSDLPSQPPFTTAPWQLLMDPWGLSTGHNPFLHL